MKNDYMAIIFLMGSKGELDSLTKYRSLASLPIGGSYRIVDFPLSNLTNAGVKNVGIFCSNSEINSLSDHIRTGREWDLDRKRDGVFIFKNIIEEKNNLNLKNIRKNIEYFSRSTQENIIITSPHILFNIDFNEVIKQHEESGKDVTLVYKEVESAHFNFENCDIVEIENEKVKSIRKNLFLSKKENISLDTYVLSKALFIKLLLKTLHNGEYNYANDVIKQNLSEISINLYDFKGHFFSINNVNDYFNFNMQLLKNDVKRDLFGIESGRKIYTKIKDTPPTLVKTSAEIKNSLISNGCIIKGKVENSILGRSTVVEEGAEVTNCVILQDCRIKKGSILKNVILDKNNVIDENQTLISSSSNPLVIEKTFRWDFTEYQNSIKSLAESEAK